MPDNDASVYTDLVGFLESERQDLREAACEAVLAVKDGDGMDKLVKHGAVRPLCRLISTPNDVSNVGLKSMRALIRLTSETQAASQCVEDCIDSGAIQRTSEIALSPLTQKGDGSGGGNVHRENLTSINCALSLLTNLTRRERGSIELLGRSSSSSNPETDSSALVTHSTLNLLVARFLEIDCNTITSLDSTNISDPYQHVASLLMNVTQTESGRKLLMRLSSGAIARNHTELAAGSTQKNEKRSSLLQAILPQLRSRNSVRRRGVAGAVKNCCFDSDSAWWLLHEVGLVKEILYPLAGPEELDVEDRIGLDPDLWMEGPDKVRESEADVRLLLVESLLLLCATGRQSRKFLRTQKVYVIIKMADMVEENEEVGEKINECVQFLRRDEEGTDEGSSDRMVENAWRRRLAASSAAPSVAYDSNTEEDLDAID